MTRRAVQPPNRSRQPRTATAPLGVLTPAVKRSGRRCAVNFAVVSPTSGSSGAALVVPSTKSTRAWQRRSPHHDRIQPLSIEQWGCRTPATTAGPAVEGAFAWNSQQRPGCSRFLGTSSRVGHRRTQANDAVRASSAKEPEWLGSEKWSTAHQELHVLQPRSSSELEMGWWAAWLEVSREP